MEKHLLFFDIDRTIYYRGYFPLLISASIKRAQKQGHYCVLNTGRPMIYIPNVLKKRIRWDGVICGGAITEFHGERLSTSLMTEEQVRRMVEILARDKTPIVFDCDGPGYCLFYNRMNPLPSPEAVFENFEAKRIYKLEVARPLSEKTLAELSEYGNCFPMPGYVDIFPKGCNKATGMKLIGEKTGIPRERMIAFGDSNNDLDMLRYAGKSVAVRNASQGAVEAATYHATVPVVGVSQGIKKYLDI